MTKDEALKLALEALETAWTYDEDNADGYYLEAITALREALAEQPAQQEPVAWMLEWAFNGEERGYRLYDDERHCVFDAESDGGVCRPLYTSPQPAQRKPLTDEQREEIAKGWRGRNWTVGDIIDAIEAAQGIGEKK